MQNIKPPTPPNNPRPRRHRRWGASAGGNRIGKLTALLIGEQNLVNHLPEDDPRRRPTLPRVSFLEVEEAAT